MKKFEILLILLIGFFSQSFFIINSFSTDSAFGSTDKPMYLDGESITIKGTVPKYETYPGSIEIVDPLGESINTIPVIPHHSK